MSNAGLKKILNHPDREEIISKLLIEISEEDIFDWLKEKYSAVSEKKFVISVRALKHFKKNHLDIYTTIQEDLQKSKMAVSNSTEEDLSLSVQNMPEYKKVMLEAANQELDVRTMIKTLCFAIEQRFGQIFDHIQEDPRNINTKMDRILIEYTDKLGMILERYYKFTEAPDNLNVTNNITLQAVDQHISVFHDVIRDVLSEMDFDASLKFIESFNNKFKKLKNPESEEVLSSKDKLKEAQILNETINETLNG